MMRWVSLSVLFMAAACQRTEQAVGAEAGAPLPGLSDVERMRFEAGRALFDRVYLPEQGLGPAFNENQCSACHTVPASGGTTGFERVVKATRYLGEAGCDPLTAEGGENVRTQMTPLLREHGFAHESVPATATEVGRFTPPFLFGLGLIETIEAATILASTDPDDADGDGISGRPGRTRDGRLGRFGRKADFATIREFNEGALRLEMGMTTPSSPEEPHVSGAPVPASADPAPDPEADSATVALLTDFVRFLAPARADEPRSAAHADTVRAGGRLFERIGCARCHTPTMRTGPSDVAALDHKTVRLYSDLLLHEMGPALADVCGPGASPGEVRTEMLAGLGRRERFLHDGRTADLAEAVLAHGGEAGAARTAFTKLSWLERLYLLAFLHSL